MRSTHSCAVPGDGAVVNHSVPGSPSVAAATDFGYVVRSKGLEPDPPRAGESHRRNEPAHCAARGDDNADNNAHSEQMATAAVAAALM